MNEIIINEHISYIETSNNPLSADIGIIKTNNNTWLYDVGNESIISFDLNKIYNVVISHFHLDHMGNINKIKINNLYVSKETYKHLPKDLNVYGNVIIVDKTIEIDNLKIFPLPSSHAKGSLALEVDNSYTFLGDGTYTKHIHDHKLYNAQLLNDEIKILKNLKSSYFLLSHFKGLIRNKEDVINELEIIYQKRVPDEPYILIK